MATGKVSVEPAETALAYRKYVDQLSEAEFSSFFFGLPEEVSFLHGEWDFSAHIGALVMPHLRATKRCLEIGSGAGRLIAPAARHFDYALGLDLHNRHEFVSKLLQNRGVKNGASLPFNGKEWPIRSASIDLVYSLYVLTYSGTVDAVKYMLAEAARVLRPDGLALIYYGVRSSLATDRNSRGFELADRLIERIPPWNRPLSWSAPINQKNLAVPEPAFSKLATESGFQILLRGRSRRLFAPACFAGQRFMLLQHARQS